MRTSGSKKKIYIIGASIIVLGIAAIVMKKNGLLGANDDGMEVEWETAKTMTITELVSATGKIQPEIEVKISSQVSGEIIDLPVKEGQVVRKGQLLVRINPDLYTAGLNRTVSNLSSTKANLNQAEATFKEAEASYARSQALFEKGIISKADWDKATAAFQVAQANRKAAYFNVQSANATVKEAKDNLGRTSIFAPADGTISSLSVELGERILGTQQMAGTELMRVANLNQMEVLVDVNENDIVKVSIGDSTRVQVDAYLKKEFKGIVTSISNSATTATTADQVTNFKVKVRLLPESYADLMAGKPAHYSPFRPGMTATVDIVTRRKVNVTGIPVSAVVVKTDTTGHPPTAQPDFKNTNEAQAQAAPVKNRKKMECVFVQKGKKVRIRVIKTGIQDDKNIEVVSGLQPGEKIVSGPYNTLTKDLYSGASVKAKSQDTEVKKK